MADWKFIALLATSGIVNFWLAKMIIKKEDESFNRRFLFYTGLIFNIGILLYFKYFNFFIQSFVTLFNYSDSVNISFTPFHILLPLGISFFTFQMIGYLIDVDKEEIEPTNDYLSFFTYLAYFPKLLSGPIEKAQDFLPQIQRKRQFNYDLAVDGLRQILWGLFKKIVIANSLTALVNIIFNDYQNLSSSTLIFGSIFYTISLYADFSGYSDMACGVSKLFNIKITNNFAFPFFSTNISDFWKKWHISLTSWMMNYVYAPISFITREYKKFGLIISINFTFLLVGLWHGANWTFVIFGLYQGLLFIPLIFKGAILKNKKIMVNKFGLPSLNDFFKIIGTFLLVSFGMIIFRAENVEHAIGYISGMFKHPGSYLLLSTYTTYVTTHSLVFIFLIIEWFGRQQEYALQHIDVFKNVILRWFVYFVMVVAILFMSQNTPQEFIYFAF
ncbi:MBOAT family protein [Winogradskyella sp.]|nr:MBOAT family protein [Winogradskyella sp.]